MAKRSRKVSTKHSQRSKSSSRKTMKRRKRQSSRKQTLNKRKSRTKSVRKRKKTKKGRTKRGGDGNKHGTQVPQPVSRIKGRTKKLINQKEISTIHEEQSLNTIPTHLQDTLQIKNPFYSDRSQVTVNLLDINTYTPEYKVGSGLNGVVFSTSDNNIIKYSITNCSTREIAKLYMKPDIPELLKTYNTDAAYYPVDQLMFSTACPQQNLLKEVYIMGNTEVAKVTPAFIGVLVDIQFLSNESRGLREPVINGFVMKKGEAIKPKDFNIRMSQLSEHIITLHTEGIVHNDIKDANSVTVDNQLKLIDFGSAHQYSNTHKNSNTALYEYVREFFNMLIVFINRMFRITEIENSIAKLIPFLNPSKTNIEVYKSSIISQLEPLLRSLNILITNINESKFKEAKLLLKDIYKSMNITNPNINKLNQIKTTVLHYIKDNSIIKLDPNMNAFNFSKY
jgi:hypothetical protein